MMKKIEDYQLRELEEDKIFINEYDLDLKYDYELKSYWKEFFFDILETLTLNDFEFHLDFLAKNSLFDYMKNHYKDIIKDYQLNIDIRDYIEISDYVSYQEWKKDPNHGIAYFENEIFLITK